MHAEPEIAASPEGPPTPPEGPPSPPDGPPGPSKRSIPLWLLVALGALLTAVVVGAVIDASSRPTQTAASPLATNPALDPGTPLSGQAPDFTLTDQFNRPVSLHSFRGKVVLLAFNDSECTTICPLTTTAMVQAKRMLGAAGSQVQLLGIDANPNATAVRDVRAYSEAHGMVHEWNFLTAPLPELKRVWRAYNIGVAIERGQIDHTPALYVIDTHGRLARLYMSQLSYAAVPQLGQLLAQEAARLLPGHRQVHSRLSYVHISGISPTQRVSLPRVGGGRLAVGAGAAPRLYLFFASWDQQVLDLRGELAAIGAYQTAASAHHLPSLTAVDEGSLEPDAGSLSRFLTTLPRPLPYPVAVDRSGRVADGYEVQDEPWLVLTSPGGRILWYYDVSVGGMPSTATIVRQVRAALARSPKALSTAAAQAQLAGSPAPLALLHQQAERVLGNQSALRARIRALRGYPIVLNVWGTWCPACVAEFGLLGTASAQYGRRVAFLGADVLDSAADGHSFMQQHPVSYPSYQTTPSELTSIVPQGVLGWPTTIFISPQGKVTYVHTGQYETQGNLNSDIATYALRG